MVNVKKRKANKKKKKDLRKGPFSEFFIRYPHK